MRNVSIEGLTKLGGGANGQVYRLNSEQIIKVYDPLTSPPEKIKREKEAARKTFIRGIPSAISFDIVRVGERYGMIYEMLEADTLGAWLSKRPGEVRESGVKMAELLKQLHSTEFEEGELPDGREGLRLWADISRRSGYYRDSTLDKLDLLISSIPPRNTFVHGDLHPGNIMVRDGEWLLIDMGDASAGHPVLDLLGCYHIMQIALHRGGAQKYTKMNEADLNVLWGSLIRSYLGTDDEEMIGKAEGVLGFYALIRSMAGVTFSELVPSEDRPSTTATIQEVFLRSYDKYGSEAYSLLQL